jgi:predicted ester cyclase
MIGILCSSHTEEKLKEFFVSLVKRHGHKWDDSFVLFKISDMNLDNRIIEGSLISDDGIRCIQTQIPLVIFNMAVQKDIKSIRCRAALEDSNVVKVINPLNRYNQWMIMEILSSSPETKKLLLRYYLYDKKKRDFSPEDEKSYIIMPARGSSLQRVILAKPEAGSERVGGTQYFRKGHILDYIDASLCQKRWLFMEAPELIMHNNHPTIIRVYLQRFNNNTWEMLGKDIYPESQLNDIDIPEASYNTFLTAAMHITHFIPNLGYCFMDFVVSPDKKPYFLHFGGFNQDFFHEDRNDDFHENFYKNIINLAACYGSSTRGE